jgi:hypothetical protein
VLLAGDLGLGGHPVKALWDEDQLLVVALGGGAAAGAGARGAGYVALRLPLEIKDLFQQWLATDHPDRAARITSLVRQMRGGKDYDAQWGRRMKGQGPLADLMSRRFSAARARYGLAGRLGDLDLARFAVPPRSGDQIDLFGAAT